MSFDDRLRRELHRAGESASLPPIGFEATLERGRRERRKMMVLMMGAAAAILAIGVTTAVALTRDARPAPRPVPPAESPENPAPTPGDRSTRALDVAGEWMDAIASGNADAAHSLMINPFTDEARMSRAELDASIGPDWAELYRGILDADDLELRFVPLVSEDEGSAGLVLGVATTQRGGDPEQSTVAVPVRVTREGTYVDLPSPEEVSFTPRSPSDVFPERDSNLVGSSFRARAEIETELELGELFVALDGDLVPADAEFIAEGRLRVTAGFSDVALGRHVLAYLVLDNAGGIHAYSFAVHQTGN